MDWSRCPDVESVLGKVSGAWLVKGTRVQADAIVENAAEGVHGRGDRDGDLPDRAPETSQADSVFHPHAYLSDLNSLSSSYQRRRLTTRLPGRGWRWT